MKRFKTKESLDKWISDNFYEEPENAWELPAQPQEKDVAEKLLADGYDLDNLIKNGQAYEIDGHTNNGWLFEGEVSMEYAESMRAAGKLIKRDSIHGKRLLAGLSRAEMARRFEIPIRTLENWESGVNNPPGWAEKLIIEKLEKIKEEEIGKA